MGGEDFVELCARDRFPVRDAGGKRAGSGKDERLRNFGKANAGEELDMWAS